MFGFKSRRKLEAENALLRQIIAAHEENYASLQRATLEAQASFNSYRQQTIEVINELAGKLESSYRLGADGTIVCTDPQAAAPVKPARAVDGNVINVEFKR